MNLVASVMTSDLRSSSADQAVEFDSRSAHSQPSQDPPDDVVVVDTMDMVEVVEYVMVKLDNAIHVDSDRWKMNSLAACPAAH